MSRSYDIQRRVLMCGSCGGPKEVAAQGGAATCGACGHGEEFAPRPRYESLAKKGPGGALDESERFSRLRAQDGKPLLPPQSLLSLFGPDGSLAEWKVDEAVTVFLSGAKNASQSGDFGAAQQVYILALALGNRFQLAGDDERRRAVYETALEALELPRMRQVMLGCLSRAAAAEGDIGSATQWLQPCDPRSDDLESDSSYRVSKATIETARKNWAGVLETLGHRHMEVPIMDSTDPLAVVLRANALERSGKVDEAASELQSYMGEGAAGRTAIKKIIDSLAMWHPCELSHGRAAEGYSRAAAEKTAAAVGGGVGVVFLVVGTLFLFGAGVGLFLLLSGIGPEGLGGLAMMGLPGLIFSLIGLRSYKEAKKAAYIRTHGISGTGALVSASRTGVRINKVPQYALTLTIHLEGRDPYQAITKILFDPTNAAALTAGTQLPVRVHPKDPRSFIVEAD